MSDWNNVGHPSGTGTVGRHRQLVFYGHLWKEVVCKAHLRKAAERTVEGLWKAIAASSKPSSPRNAETISLPQDMIQPDRMTL